MALHPTVKAMLDKVAHLPPMHSFTVEEVRATDLSRYTLVPRPDVAKVEDRTIPGPRGDLTVRIFRPDLEDGKPVVVFFHGGGFSICSIDTHEGLCRQIATRAGMIVVSVDYGLAPENKFPAGIHDCLAATRWVGENARSFGGDPARLALAGDSSGGTFAAVTALRIRDEGGPAIAAQLMIYPPTDYHTAGTRSSVERATGYGLTTETVKWFWSMYLNDPSEGEHPHAAPNKAEDLRGLPPAYVVTAEYDPLRDEGVAYAARLKAAGVDTTHAHYADVHHGFMPWAGIIDRSDEALDAAAAWLKAKV